MPDLVTDVEEHLPIKGPWQYTLSERYSDPAVTAAVEQNAAAELPQIILAARAPDAVRRGCACGALAVVAWPARPHRRAPGTPPLSG